MIKDVNTILNFFMEKKGFYSLNEGDFNGIDKIAIINRLIQDGLLHSKLISNGRNTYVISLNGRVLINELPKEFKNNPYGYFLKNKHSTNMVTEAVLLKYFYKQEKRNFTI